MRKLSPAFVVASVALAMASGTALAQARISSTPGTTSAGTTTVTTTQGGTRTASGGCVGTGGSSCSATTTSAGGSAGSGVVVASTGPSEINPNENVSAPAPVAVAPTVAPTTSAPPPVFVSNLAPDAPFRTTPNPPTATPTAAALGRSLGQTSAGTASGNSGLGLTGDSLGLSPAENLGNDLGTGVPVTGPFFVPGATTAGFTGGPDAGNGVNANGERLGNGGADFRGSVVAQSTPTPIFDAVAARALARQQARRARGDQPRIIGMAPRTERDLTHQMPDDPIIRY